MNKDIELTKMDNAYRKASEEISLTLKKLSDDHNIEYAKYALQKLSVEFSARHLVAIKATQPDITFEDAIQGLLQDICGKTVDLFVLAENLGILKVEKK